MTNNIALFLSLTILILVGTDYFVFQSEHLLFLARKFLELLEWVAFWR